MSKKLPCSTGTAIALTAAMKGATIANYVEMTGLVHEGPPGKTATGVKCVDKLTGEEVGAAHVQPGAGITVTRGVHPQPADHTHVPT